jgi:hypothetical protein
VGNNTGGPQGGSSSPLGGFFGNLLDFLTQGYNGSNGGGNNQPPPGQQPPSPPQPQPIVGPQAPLIAPTPPPWVRRQQGGMGNGQ